MIAYVFMDFSSFFNDLDVHFQDVNSIQSTADEMELFAVVNRKYKHFFIKQEHLLTFRMYDYFEVSLDVFLVWFVAGCVCCYPVCGSVAHSAMLKKGKDTVYFKK